MIKQMRRPHGKSNWGAEASGKYISMRSMFFHVISLLEPIVRVGVGEFIWISGFTFLGWTESRWELRMQRRRRFARNFDTVCFGLFPASKTPKLQINITIKLNKKEHKVNIHETVCFDVYTYIYIYILGWTCAYPCTERSVAEWSGTEPSDIKLWSWTVRLNIDFECTVVLKQAWAVILSA